MTQRNLVTELEQFYSTYLTTSADNVFVAALWACATYLWPSFDAFPYMVVTSDTKRSGKTRLSELLAFTCSNPRRVTAATPAALFRIIKDEQPTLLIDEAEALSSGRTGLMREFLNSGYRVGQEILRAGKEGVVGHQTYCPKLFILIGDVSDTLRDRAIVITLSRGAPAERFQYVPVQAEGNALGASIKEYLGERKIDVQDAYNTADNLDFLNERDEEIWLPLFAICSIMAPERVQALKRIAVDMATMKTAPAKMHNADLLRTAEIAATNAEFAEQLLSDLASVVGEDATIFTQDALDRLYAIDIAPWRKFRGTGLDASTMADLLKTFAGVAPRLVRSPGGRKSSKVQRGYRVEDITAALAKLRASTE